MPLWSWTGARPLSKDVSGASGVLIPASNLEYAAVKQGTKKIFPQTAWKLAIAGNNTFSIGQHCPWTPYSAKLRCLPGEVVVGGLPVQERGQVSI